MYCLHCGKQIEDGSKFCLYCGKSVSTEPQKQKPSEIPIPNQSSANTVQESYSAEENVQKKKITLLPKNKFLRIGLIIWIGIIAFYTIFNIGNIVWQKWLEANFPYYSSSGPNKNDLFAGTVTSTLSTGGTFGQKDFSFIPIEISYVSNKVGYDDYGEPYVTIALEITCLFGKWKPQPDDIKFWLNGNPVLNYKYTDTEIKRGESARYTFTQPLSSSTNDVSMQLTVKCTTGATVNLSLPVSGVSDFFGGNTHGNPSNNDTYPPTSPPTNPVSDTTIEYDDLVGSYAAGPADDIASPSLNISIDGSTLCIFFGTYRGGAGTFEIEFAPKSKWPKIENNSIHFSAEEMFWNETYNITLEFIPAEKSSNGVDTIYLKGSSRFEDLEFTRNNSSSIYDGSTANTMGEYDDIAGTYIDEYGSGFYMSIGYEDSSKQVAYLEIGLVAETVLVKLGDRYGDHFSGHNLSFYPQGTEPSQIVVLDYNSYDSSITATIYAVTQDCTIRFVPCPDAMYLNPFYVD